MDGMIADKLGVGWFLNVGPTGLRVCITSEQPKSLTVKFVFDKPPAHGGCRTEGIRCDGIDCWP